MKRMSPRIVVLAVAALAAFGFAASANAYPHQPHGEGYIDGNGHYHPYTTHEGKRGYWDQRSGVLVWTTVK